MDRMNDYVLINHGDGFSFCKIDGFLHCELDDIRNVGYGYCQFVEQWADIMIDSYKKYFGISCVEVSKTSFITFGFYNNTIIVGTPLAMDKIERCFKEVKVRELNPKEIQNRIKIITQDKQKKREMIIDVIKQLRQMKHQSRKEIRQNKRIDRKYNIITNTLLLI